MADPEIRQRKTAKPEAEAEAISPAALAKREDHSPFNWLDVARSLVFLILLSGGVSYFVTGESFVWNLQRPKWTNVEVIKSWIQGPKQYTDADLKAYDGTNPDLPILLAVNGTIYDVSKGRKHYGPGGSYHFFAGTDAARAFVTGCFQTDCIPDMRGVEEMFLPYDDPEVDSLYSKGELKILREREKREARRQVHEKLKHWVDFFENSRKYVKIGQVKREKGWETKGEPPVLCKQALEAKPKSRKRPEGK